MLSGGLNKIHSTEHIHNMTRLSVENMGGKGAAGPSNKPNFNNDDDEVNIIGNNNSDNSMVRNQNETVQMIEMFKNM